MVFSDSPIKSLPFHGLLQVGHARLLMFWKYVLAQWWWSREAQADVAQRCPLVMISIHSVHSCICSPYVSFRYVCSSNNDRIDSERAPALINENEWILDVNGVRVRKR